MLHVQRQQLCIWQWHTVQASAVDVFNMHNCCTRLQPVDELLLLQVQHFKLLPVPAGRHTAIILHA
jgi:hypothetical protein